MLIKYLREMSVSNACRCLVFVMLVLLAMPVFAQDEEQPPPTPPITDVVTQAGNLSAQDVLTNLVKQVPNLMRLVTAIAYVLGMYLIFAGIVQFKHFGESRTMMSSEHNITKPIIMLAVGAALLYLPTTVQVGMSTFWTEPNPYAYIQQQDQWSQFINGCFLVIQFIGTIAFIRGLLLLSHLGGHHGGQGNFGKGLTHIIGGVLCINIYQFVQVVLMTIGIQT